MDSQFEVPIEALLAAVEDQRNAALTDAAQMRALAHHLKAELGQARAEIERLTPSTEADESSPLGQPLST